MNNTYKIMVWALLLWAAIITILCSMFQTQVSVVEQQNKLLKAEMIEKFNAIHEYLGVEEFFVPEEKPKGLRG